MKEIKIKATELKLEISKTGKFELVYIPDQTQVLEAGKKYVFDLNIAKPRVSK